MDSTQHQLPGRSKEPVPATTKPSHVFHESEAPHSTDGPSSNQPWQPRYDRRQSWSTEDYKHELQERMLNAEGHLDSGFSEKSEEHQK